jgi:hypothetical protein
VLHKNSRANTSDVNASATVLAALLLLSQSDMLVKFNQGSTFVNAADDVSACGVPRVAPAVFYMMIQKLARALYRFKRNDPFAKLQMSKGWSLSDGPHCLRDCLRLDPRLLRNVTCSHALLARVEGGTLVATRRMSSECKHACACWLQAGLA